jgi:sugar lactone lactonase YvrE
MKIAIPELLTDSRAYLGEGPAWDSVRQCLYWVDIFAGHLHFFSPGDGTDKYISLDGHWLTCAAPTRSGKMIVGLRSSLAIFDPHNTDLTILATPEIDQPGNRFNDGKAAPDGRFLAGTMDNAEVAASGALYSFAFNGSIKKLLSGIRISNGLAWSPNYQTLYYIDTPTRQVMAYDYDSASGDVANPRIAVTVPAELGWPDGMTSDADGNLWMAMWGGAALTVWNPAKGILLKKIDIPAVNVTSCAFGGPDLNELYITSARKGVDEAGLAKFPNTGGLFRIKTNVTGLPTFVFHDQ